MSKRKKKKEEEYEYEMPEFDKEEYMEKEITKAKSVMVSIALAPVFAFASSEVFALTREAAYGFLVGILGLLVIGIVMDMVGIDTKSFDKKEWAMNWGMFFFTWLAVFVLLMNPPFHDYANPTLNSMDVQIDQDGEWVPLDEANVTAQEEYDIRLVAKVTDNVELKEDSVDIYFDDGWHDMEKIDDHKYAATFNGTVAQVNPYDYTVSAEDVNGNDVEIGDTFYLIEQED